MRKDLADNYSILNWIRSVRNEPIRDEKKPNNPIERKSQKMGNLSVLLALPATKAFFHLLDSLNEESLDPVKVIAYSTITAAFFLGSFHALKKSLSLKKESRAYERSHGPTDPDNA